MAAEDIRPPARGPIATVNGREIARARFDELYAHAARRLDDSPRSAGRAVALQRTIARQLIDELLIEEEARRRGLMIADSAVDAVIGGLRRGLRTEERWNTYLRQRGGGLEELRRATRIRLLTEALAGPGEPLKPDEARAFYDKHRARFSAPASVVVHDVAFALPPDTPPEPARAMRARAVAAATLLQKSTAPAVAKQTAGTVRVVRLTASDGALWSAALPLGAGEASGVIETGGALHVLKVLRRDAARSQTFEQARPAIEASLRRQKRSTSIAKLLAALRASAKIENHLEARHANRRRIVVDPNTVTPRPGVPQKLPRSVQ